MAEAAYIDIYKVYEEACAGCWYHGDEVGSCNLSEPCEKLVRAFASAPAADVVEVVHGKPVVKVRPVTITDYHEEIGRFAADGSTLYRKNMVHVEIQYKHCPVCGATLCSRWYNYCGKCGAKIDGGENDVSG